MGDAERMAVNETADFVWCAGKDGLESFATLLLLGATRVSLWLGIRRDDLEPGFLPDTISLNSHVRMEANETARVTNRFEISQ